MRISPHRGESSVGFFRRLRRTEKQARLRCLEREIPQALHLIGTMVSHDTSHKPCKCAHAVENIAWSSAQQFSSMLLG
eukprot:12899751-Prorocentrum_lima.AAC.1